LTAWKFHCGLPKLLACGDSTGNLARLDQTFSELLHFHGAPMTAIGRYCCKSLFGVANEKS
jgi:hypothetical protein